MTALLLLRRRRRCCFRARSSRRRRRSCTSPTSSRSSRRRSATGAASSSRSFRASSRRSGAAGCADPGALETFERCKLDLERARVARGRVRAAPRSAAAPARGRGVRRAAARRRRRRRAVRRRRSCCASSRADHRDDRLLVVNLGARPAARSRSPSRCSRRRPARDWQLRWSSEDPRVRRAGHGRAVSGRVVAHPGGIGARADRRVRAGRGARCRRSIAGAESTHG